MAEPCPCVTTTFADFPLIGGRTSEDLFQGPIYQEKVNGDYVITGIGTRNTGSGGMVLTLPPGAIVKAAYLYWNTLTSKTDAVSSATANFEKNLDGPVAITGDRVGACANACWECTAPIEFAFLGSQTIESADTMTLNSITVLAGERLVVGLAVTQINPGTNAVVKFDGNTMTNDTGGNILGNIYSYAPGVDTTGDIVVTTDIFTIPEIVTGMALWAAKLKNLTVNQAFPSGFNTATGNNDNPKSGSTLTSPTNNSIAIGNIGTDGPSTDTAGTWAGGFTDAVRVGTTTSPTVSGAYLLTPLPQVSVEAEKTGITSTGWSANIVIYE